MELAPPHRGVRVNPSGSIRPCRRRHAHSVGDSGLTKRFGDKVAVDAIDLAVPRGSFYELVGQNGEDRHPVHGGRSADARHVLTSNVYDKLGRLTETWLGKIGVTGSVKQTATVYDTFYKGQVAGTVRCVGSAAYTITYPQRDNLYRVTNLATRVVTGTRYYSFAGRTVATRTPSALSWTVSDPHNTNSCAIDAATGAITWRRTLPYADRDPDRHQAVLLGSQQGALGQSCERDPNGSSVLYGTLNLLKELL
ncbi:hypothetical protein [Dactylosporangium maewongense]|uniref:hypothetical protein n=1 Tax=Dactylosporangium maewongense TaxID=634393 RepID=UPI0031D1F1D0